MSSPAGAALPGEREPAPLGAAGALAYALLGRGRRTGDAHGVLQVVTVVVAAQLLASVPHMALGSGPGPDQAARRVLAVASPPCASSRSTTRAGRSAGSARDRTSLCFLLVLLVLTALCDAVLAALTRRPHLPPVRAAAARRAPRPLGIGSAVCATGAVMALGVAVAGLWALPVLCVPLLLTQLSFRRYAAVRTTYRQTIASLARATEIAGYTPHGHARRVAALATAVGRELGLTGRSSPSWSTRP